MKEKNRKSSREEREPPNREMTSRRPTRSSSRSRLKWQSRRKKKTLEFKSMPRKRTPLSISREKRRQLGSRRNRRSARPS